MIYKLIGNFNVIHFKWIGNENGKSENIKSNISIKISGTLFVYHRTETDLR